MYVKSYLVQRVNSKLTVVVVHVQDLGSIQALAT
jgi:hypothetical protein